MIIYKNNTDNITPEMISGFFSPSGWKEFPSPEIFLILLKNSQHKILAVDDERNSVIGFIYAISDKVLSAYIPLLVVLPDYQNRGLGRELVKRMLNELKYYYIIDLLCDEERESFYSRFGMKKYSAMMIQKKKKKKGR